MAILEQPLKSLTAIALAPVQLLVIPPPKISASTNSATNHNTHYKTVSLATNARLFAKKSTAQNLIPCSIIPDDLLKLSLKLLHQRIPDRRPWATQKRYG